MPPPLPPGRNTPPPLPSPVPPPLPPSLPTTLREPVPRRKPALVRRWVLIALALCFAGFCAERLHWAYGVMKNHSARTSGEPGEDAFRAANRSIIRFRGKEGLGNTPEAERLAVRFAHALRQAREEGFTAGNEKAFSLSQHQFLAYCRLNRDSCVFLVHVPELRRFTADARSSLAELAWLVAHDLVQDARLSADAQLVVAVKGTLNYEAIFIGGMRNQGEPLKDVVQDIRGFDLNKTALLHPFFAEDEAVATPDDVGAPEADAGALPAIVAPSVPPAGYLDYEGLLGEGFQGNVFVIETHGRRWAVMSRHQFEDGVIPQTAVDLDSEPLIALLPATVVRQRDVQLIAVADQAAPLRYLAFDPLFELQVGEKLWIERGPGKQGTEGTLLSRGLRHGRYRSLEGPATLSLKLDAPVNVSGASGLPVIRLKTGLPVGVLLAADQAQGARLITFEPLCVTGKLGVPVPADAEIHRRMIGEWTEHFPGSDASGPSRTLFDANGNFSCAFTGLSTKAGEPIWVKGRWRIEAGRMIYFDLSSNDPDYPIKVYTDQIIEMGENHLIYMNSELPDLQLMRKTAATVPVVAP